MVGTSRVSRENRLVRRPEVGGGAIVAQNERGGDRSKGTQKTKWKVRSSFYTFTAAVYRISFMRVIDERSPFAQVRTIESDERSSPARLCRLIDSTKLYTKYKCQLMNAQFTYRVEIQTSF